MRFWMPSESMSFDAVVRFLARCVQSITDTLAQPDGCYHQ